MTKDEERRELVLNGNLWKVIISIAAPIIIFNMINAFYNVFDASIASNISATSVSAVSALSQIKNLLSAFGVGIATGGSILIARKIGANDFLSAKKITNVLFAFSIIVVAILMCICIPGAQTIMRLSNIDEELIAIGTGYFIISIIDIGFLFFNNIFMGLQKAKANTKVIFVLNIIGMSIKLSLSIIFVYVLNVDNILWIALATMISQIVIFSIAMVIMTRKNNPLQVTIKGLSLNKKILKSIIIISIPIFIGKAVFSLGKVIINAMCMEYGTLVVGALSVSGNLGAIGVMATASFEEVSSGIVSQNLGNKNMKRALHVFTHSFCISLCMGIVGFILVRFIFFENLLSLFTQNESDADNAEFIEYIRLIFKYESLSMISLAINATILGLLYGYGQTKIAMVINICRVFVLRIPVLWVIQKFFPELGVEGVGIAMGISNVGVAVFSACCLCFFLLKVKKHGYQGMRFTDRLEDKTI